MLRQFLTGSAVSTLQYRGACARDGGCGAVAQTVGAKNTSQPWLHVIGVMIATVSVLMAAHTSEVLVWSLAYAIVDAAPPGVDLVYSAFVNYTTLGYGDVIPLERWRLLGPMTAMNGVLSLRVVDGVIFEVLRKHWHDTPRSWPTRR